MNAKELVIIGAGETALLAYEYFTHDSNFEVVAFSVDRAFIKETSVCGLPVVAFDELVNQYPPERCCCFVAMGSAKLNRQRAEWYCKAKEKGYRLASYVSSRAFVWHNVEIGDNCFILEDNTLQPFVKIGNNVVLWSGNHVGHRSKIADHCFITSHVVISGFCSIGESSFIGVNATLADEVSIGKDNFICAGAIIGESTEENKIYRGAPSEVVKVSARRFSRVPE